MNESETVNKIMTELKGLTFSPPASLDDISAAELKLGRKFPLILRECYVKFSHINGPVNVAYLVGPKKTAEWTKDLISDFPDIGLEKFVFFGMSYRQILWGVTGEQPYRYIAYEWHMEGKPEELGSDLFEVYHKDMDECNHNLETAEYNRKLRERNL